MTSQSVCVSLCTKFGINPSDVVYFGDGANDASSLKMYGYGIAMNNAKPEAKAACNKRP